MDTEENMDEIERKQRMKEWDQAVAQDLVNPTASMDRVVELTRKLREDGVFPALLPTTHR
jgi:hypothetical protein